MSPEIVIFDKLGGPLTKRICLDERGAAKSDGSACVMSRGMATRMPVESIGQLGALIENMKPHQAIALGSLRRGLPLMVAVDTKRMPEKVAERLEQLARSAVDRLVETVHLH